jgi:hypothetical protein
MSQNGLAEAFELLKKGQIKYRAVLTEDSTVFGW